MKAGFLRKSDLRALLLIGIAVLSVRCQASTSAAMATADDFKYQGEFIGKVETVSPILGVQVVANGAGQFTAAFLPGGLPGAGWDTTQRIEQSGSLQPDGIHFQATDSTKQYTATISTDGVTLSGKTPKGELFTLLKTDRKSPTLDSAPPSNAVVLFNGKDLSAFVSGSAALDSGLLLPQGSASSGAVTLAKFGSFTLHLEFLEPFMPDHTGQSRGNSGVYLQGRYELQILDSFGLNIYRGRPGEETQECGAFYQLVAPRLNMSLPPLAWQTYDVDFTKATFDASGKTLIAPALVTVRQNGVLIHDHQKLINNTLLGDSVTSADGPIRIQAHGDPVKYRNIWIIPGAGTDIRPIQKRSPGLTTGGFGSGGLVPTSTLVNGKQSLKPAASGCYLPTRPGQDGDFLLVK
jgi:hypothetical protein